MQPVVAAMYLGVCVATANQNYTKGEYQHKLGTYDNLFCKL